MDWQVIIISIQKQLHIVRRIVLQIVYKKKATNCVGLDYEFEIKLNILVYLHGLLAFRYALMKKPNRPKKEELGRKVL